MVLGKMSAFSIIFLVCLALSSLAIKAVDVSYDGRTITIDGKRKVLFSGSIHYPRSTAEMWPSLIKKAKEGGVDVIETYVFWNAHEPLRRQYDFSGNLDLVRFIKTILNEGLYAMLRIGPYVCVEWNYGTNNPAYEDEMKTFTTMIVDMMKRENLFASQGGPIILAQINTCNGWYCDQFKPNSGNKPKMWTENWTGWYNNWGGPVPHRTAEDLAFAVARFFQYGGTFQNYYMYHGGTNFGRTSGGPYITTSYDYDAPLDEYGNLNQPKWGHLKQLHEVLKSMEDVLTQGYSRNVEYGDMTTATIYSYAGKSVCFLGNAHSSKDKTINFQNTEYTVPAWSVSILPDCYTEVYNTAKVNAQTSIMVKKQNGADDEDEPYVLNWQWTYEPTKQMKNGKLLGSASMTASKILDQKVVTNDTSDYLWYITSVDLDKGDPLLSNGAKLRVKTNGHVLHFFVNGRLIGSQYAQYGNYQFDYEADIKLKLGKNEITLLSSTVGLSFSWFHGEHVTEIVKDISNNSWNYKVGLHGEHVKHYKQDNPRGWYSNNLPTDRGFVWYKTMFKSPLGTDPVVVDLRGLGKGQAWVNGNNLGRYWPKYLAGEDGCGSTCDFRGAYYSSKCVTGCGEPSQRWYRIPRSFLNDDDQNTLVLFEELGGNPYDIKFATVTIEKACANAYEGNVLELACHENQVISEIKFASFGVPVGKCGSFKKGQCESSDALSFIKTQCVGKQSCSIEVSEKVLGPTGCRVPQLRLAVDATCETSVSTEMNESMKH
ncbi:hypothetical protein RIF29_14947 [Crotalaria pallida]|uniref:beta-galactosidase n=1 Tax=Crotalaria pallida TaxID=3830 RepID=A0AAN9FJ48_CROPI